MIKIFKTYVRQLGVTFKKVMDLPDSPRKIALGVALGTSLEFLPMPFVSIPVSFVLAKLARINAAAAVLTVIFFKWAVPFFFALNYYVGRAILGGDVPRGIDSKFSVLDLSAWMEWIRQLGYPFLLGAVINSTVAAVTTYFLVRALLDYRRRKKLSMIARPPGPGGRRGKFGGPPAKQ